MLFRSNPNDDHEGHISIVTTATLALLPISRVTSSALHVPIDSIKSLESTAQLGEEKIVRIVLSNFDMPTLGVSLFL